jgi:PadR family transcriptional regulator PadR
VITLKPTISSDIIRGHIDAIVLGLLSREDMYGYQICKTIYSRSKQLYEVKEATLYSSLRRLEAQDLIASYWGDEVQGSRRKYYRITRKGREAFVKCKADWEFAKKVIDMLI